jgi:hypothetical protein
MFKNHGAPTAAITDLWLWRLFMADLLGLRTRIAHATALPEQQFR